MPFTDSPGDPIRPPAARLPLVFTGLLLVNLGLAGFLLFSQARLIRRLHKLETASASRQPADSVPSPGEVPTLAGRQERIALLLAAATDAEATRRLLDAMPSSERVEIARILVGRPAGNDRNAALGALLQKMANDDPGKAVALLAAVPEAGLRQSSAAQIAAAWIEHDPAGGAAWLAGDGQQFLTRPTLTRLLATAVTRWSAFDPAAATRFVAAQAPANDREAQELRAVSREWARKDPAAALAWTQGLPAGDPRKPPATYGVLEGWTDLDPTQAAGYVGQLSYGSNRSYAGEAAAVAARWTERDPAAAAQWAAGLPDRTARHDALRQVAASWASQDVANAGRWAAMLPASSERADIWQGIADQWAGTDLAGTESWLSTLPVGLDRDVAVATYDGKVVQADPERALIWAKTISNGVYKAREIQKLLAVWAGRMRLQPATGQRRTRFRPCPQRTADNGKTDFRVCELPEIRKSRKIMSSGLTRLPETRRSVLPPNGDFGTYVSRHY